MKQLFDFFEHFDEAVYISDADTHELLFLNRHLRELLGFPSHADYAGKTCYEVLQGMHAPCDFCNNHHLKPGEFLAWCHSNPLLQKNFLVKDTLVLHGGRRCRVEIAIDTDKRRQSVQPHFYSQSEAILNGCLKEVFSASTPDDAINRMLSYLGGVYGCERTYVFELDEEQRMSNTYEWCAQGIPPQKDLLQNEPTDPIRLWFDRFEQGDIVVLPQLEELRTQHPQMYALLKPQRIRSLAMGPIRFEKTLIGFIGVDNPSKDALGALSPLLGIIGFFLATQLRRRNLYEKLRRFGYHDPLTGVYNRNAMDEHAAQRLEASSVGVVYCDVNGLKTINDSMGHAAGDRLLCQCAAAIQQQLHTDRVYRTGGDEFAAVCLDMPLHALRQQADALRTHMRDSRCPVAIGHAWTDRQPADLDALLAEADRVMYEDKRCYYERHRRLLGLDAPAVPADCDTQQDEGLLRRFLSQNYFNPELLFEAFTQKNNSSYFYFGDMQRDIFYISDNMRTEFGFESCIVPSLTRIWEQFIVNPKHLRLYREDFEHVLQSRSTIHDLRYQVRKANGDTIWIRGYSILEWNEDRTKPLFLAGRITHQDEFFEVDPITNLPRSTVALARLHELERSEVCAPVIAFSLNNITEINNSHGRRFSDRLLKTIGSRLMDRLYDRMAFYRLEGMRCMALVDPDCGQPVPQLIDEIRCTIEAAYQEIDASMHAACSFAVIRYPYDGLTPEDLIGHVISLIRVAKSDPARPYVEYSAESVGRIRRLSRIALALRHDVTNGMKHFRIMVQPVVDAQSGIILGGEVLLRWSFEGEPVSPAVFIPMLEKGDLIHEVGLWVFEQAARSCLRLISYVPDFYLTFNISLRQFGREDFMPSLERILEKYHLNGRHLVAEMTESCLDTMPDSLTRFAQLCRRLGMRIALDDFGSGYSSMRMLLRYPCDIIKLDRSLLEEIMESDEKLQFIRSVVYACHQFGKKVCMEGVETSEQNTLIRATGCDLIQGFFHHRPMELPDLYRLLSDLSPQG